MTHYFGVQISDSIQTTFDYGKKLAAVLQHFTRHNECVSHVLNTFDALYSLYSPQDEHAEFIVRLPEIIAEGCGDDPDVKKILAPLQEYWDQVIDPAMQAYNAAHDTSTQCFDPTIGNPFLI